jgi:hypothetical protein
MIWTFHLPGPRIVEMRQVPIDDKFLHPRRRRRAGIFVTDPSRAITNTPGALKNEAEEITKMEKDGHYCRNGETVGCREVDVTLDKYGYSKLLRKKLGNKSVFCPPPPITYVNAETYLFVRNYYERAFNLLASLPGAFFNYKIDTLYVSWDTYECRPSYNIRYQFPFRGIEMIRDPFPFHRAMADMNDHGVQHLAILIHPDLLDDLDLGWLYDMFDSFAPGSRYEDNHTLKKISLVVQNHEQEGDDPADITLIEPINLSKTIKKYRNWATRSYTHRKETMPTLVVEPVHTLLTEVQEEIRRFDEYRTQFAIRIGEGWQAPEIEWKVVVGRTPMRLLEDARWRYRKALESYKNYLEEQEISEDL